VSLSKLKSCETPLKLLIPHFDAKKGGSATIAGSNITVTLKPVFPGSVKVVGPTLKPPQPQQTWTLNNPPIQVAELESIL
jgi:hypothetical protein